MKTILLSVFALTLAFEASAQRRTTSSPGRSTPTRTETRQAPTRTETRQAPTRVETRREPTRTVRPAPTPTRTYTPTYSTSGRRVVVPRYTPNRYSTRVIRTVRRPTIIWSSGFGYTCSYYGDLHLNGRFVHSFRFNSDCQQALVDIRNYGDFCDNEDLYDQSGILEAQFYYNYECREALGWYY